MITTTLRCLAICSLVSVFSVTASAQQTDGGTDDTTAANGDTDTAAFGTLDPDSIFSAVERSDTAGSNTATVGRDDSGGGGATAAGGFGGGGLGGLGGLGSLFGGFGAGTSQNTRPAIRTRLRSAINAPPIPAAQVQMNAMGRFRSLATRPALNGISVNMRDRTAVISGVVSSDRDRRMSELLIRLEPGVARVDNQVVVSPASPADR
jgi:hypothetical protein